MYSLGYLEYLFRWFPDMFNLVVGVARWWLRVSAYAFIFITDQYPPFRLSD